MDNCLNRILFISYFELDLVKRHVLYTNRFYSYALNGLFLIGKAEVLGVQVRFLTKMTDIEK